MKESRLINENDECPICLNVLFRPTKLTTCHHIFCEPCINEASSFYEHKNCPLCRTGFTPAHQVLQMDRQKELEKLYPKELQERVKNLKQSKYFKLEIGNTTEVINTQENNKYRWSLFVRPAAGEPKMDKYVESIEVKLHPTFNPPKISFKNSEEVVVKRVGWGTFRIQIKVTWKKEFGGFVDTFHDLEFQPLKSRVVVLRVGAN